MQKGEGMSRENIAREAPLLQLYLRSAALVMALMMGTLCMGVTLARMLGGGAVIQYGLAAPDDRVIYVGLDVTRELRLTLNEPLPARLFSVTDTAPDGRQVVADQNGGHVDLFLVEVDGARRQLTHLTDFIINSDERASRRANLYPSWSPDSRWITFISSTVSGRLDLYVVHPDGSAMHHLGDRIRVAAPFSPRWVTFDTELPTLWLIGSAASLLLLIWLFKGYNRSGSYSG
jgi:hypothetical protein